MSDQVRRPLKRRTAAERLRLLRPTALQAASTFTACLLTAAALWLVLAPWPEPSSPIIRIAMTSSDPVETATSEAAARAPSTDRPPSPAPAAAQLAAAEPPANAVAVDDLPTSADDAADAADTDARSEQPVVISADRLSMVAAPVKTVSEGGPYGPLPRIGKDGRKPWQVYARPIHRQLLASAGPKVAIVLGGMGLNGELTERAIRELPGEVSLAFAPYADGLQRVVNRARANGHEVYLQLPMEPLGYPEVSPGPHTLLAAMSPQETLDNLAWFMGRFAGYVGVMNYMGAQLVANAQALAPIMAELARRGLVFLDDGSFARSQAEDAGRSAGMAVKRAQIMIDGDATEEATRQALQRLEAQAAREGLAVGVGSGLPSTIKAVAGWAAAAKSRGIVLVPVSAYFR
jgi:polysaccharide deacetylase 2 family uncharacterized protein YibQ